MRYGKDTDISSTESGILANDFEKKTIVDSDGKTHYFFPKTQMGSYSTIITSTGNNIGENENINDYLKDKPNLRKIYYTALARERYGMYRGSENSEARMIEAKQ